MPYPYYALPDSVVLIPFHSLNGANPGHLVWDDFLPIYTLLHMFGLLPSDLNNNKNNNNRQLLLLRHVLNDGQPRGLWASCDVRAEKKALCHKMMNKFLPLLVGTDNDNDKQSPFPLTTNRDFAFQPKKKGSNNEEGAELVCATNGLAGMGSYPFKLRGS